MDWVPAATGLAGWTGTMPTLSEHSGIQLVGELEVAQGVGPIGMTE